MGSLRILLVEDSLGDAAQIRTLLDQGQGMRFEVRHVECLREALDCLEGDRFDAVLLDLSLPDSDGLATLSTVLSPPLPERPPVIVVSGVDEEQLAIDALQAGAEDYLVKDGLQASMLTRTLRGAAERHRIAEELRRVREQARFLASHCPLTGLPNRDLLRDRLETAIAAADRDGGTLAFLSLDLDRLELINDTLGHRVGDQILCTVARRLVHVVRASDTTARVGGDEFAVILRGINEPAFVGRIVRRILDALSEPIFIDDRELYVSASIGISLYPDDGRDGEALRQCANAALHQAKEHGPGEFRYYTREMNLSSSARLARETDLVKAIREQQFLLHFQPKLRGDTGTIVGVEALLRWRHPSQGMIPPGQFIPLAEETGQIAEIGSWVLEEACRQSRVWTADGVPRTPISINVSPRQFWRSDLRQLVASLLDSGSLEAGLLDIEITESCLLPDVQGAIRILQGIRELGVTLSLDDFGTGFSSLSLLKRLPLDCIKIDRCFIRELPGDTRDAHITAAVIALARGLGLDVVAEGVETPEQRDFLLEHGCRIMQGFLFSEPLPPPALTPLLVKGRIAPKNEERPGADSRPP